MLKYFLLSKITHGEEDEDGLEIWEDDPESCIEVEKTECVVQEIPVPEDEEEAAEEGTADVSGEEEEPSLAESTEEEVDKAAIVFSDE